MNNIQCREGRSGGGEEKIGQRFLALYVGAGGDGEGRKGGRRSKCLLTSD